MKIVQPIIGNKRKVSINTKVQSYPEISYNLAGNAGVRVIKRRLEDVTRNIIGGL